MKKVFYSAALLLCAGLTACQKEEIGGTATESMAGQWYVDVDAVDENDQPIEGGTHYFGYDEERVLLLTYNTAANDGSKMWIDDLGAFDLATYYGAPAYPNYSLKAVVNINQDSKTFSATEADNVAAENGFGSDLYKVTIEGKILPGAGRQKNGSPADSIVFFVTYKDDPWFPDDGYTRYKVSGIRYSGLVEND